MSLESQLAYIDFCMGAIRVKSLALSFSYAPPPYSSCSTQALSRINTQL
jgi:hypothetical protein